MKNQIIKSQFEEWYFKILDANQENVIIGNIHVNKSHEMSKGICTISYEFNESKKNVTTPLAQIETSKMTLLWEKNSIGKERVQIDIEDKNTVIRGEVSIEQVVDAHQSLLKPGVMGYYRYLPFLEFYEEIIVLHGKVKGVIEYDHIPVDFTGGTYYLQRQWGSKYPNVWLWAECNHFKKKKNISLSLGIARIKLWFNYYTAFSIPVYYNNKVEVFSNYNGGQIAKLYRYKGYVHLIVTQKDKILDLRIYGKNELDCILAKETHGIRDVYGCNRIKLEIKITQNGSVILEDSSLECNIEMGGNTSKLK